MNFVILKNDEDYQKFYYYKSPPNKKTKCPVPFPCIAEMEDIEGGICGDWMQHSYVPIPKGKDAKAFLAGYAAATKKKTN